MTRPKDHLHLVQPLRMYVEKQHRYGDRHVYAPRSRFLPDPILDRFERVVRGRPIGDLGAAELKEFKPSPSGLWHAWIMARTFTERI